MATGWMRRWYWRSFFLLNTETASNHKRHRRHRRHKTNNQRQAGFKVHLKSACFFVSLFFVSLSMLPCLSLLLLFSPCLLLLCAFCVFCAFCGYIDDRLSASSYTARVNFAVRSHENCAACFCPATDKLCLARGSL